MRIEPGSTLQALYEHVEALAMMVNAFQCREAQGSNNLSDHKHDHGDW